MDNGDRETRRSPVKLEGAVKIKVPIRIMFKVSDEGLRFVKSSRI